MSPPPAEGDPLGQGKKLEGGSENPPSEKGNPRIHGRTENRITP